MKLPAITPGPWYLDGEFVYAERNRAVKAANRNSSDGNIPLAKVVRDFAGEAPANAKAIAAVPKLLDVTLKCRDKFLHYEQLHRLKCSADGDEKADRNREMADECEAALRLAGASE